MQCLIKTKACKRCGGDLSLERDIYGVYVECIQCGAAGDATDIANFGIKPPDKKPERKLITVK